MDDSIFILARILDITGKTMIAFTAIMVHHRFLREHKVDSKVLKTMKREQVIGVFGLFLMLLGFTIEMLARYYN